MKSKWRQSIYLFLFPCLLFAQTEEDFYHSSDRTKFYVEFNAGLGVDPANSKIQKQLRAVPSIIRFSFGFKMNKSIGMGIGGGVDNYQTENVPFYLQFNGCPWSFGKLGINYVLRLGALIGDGRYERGITVYHPSVGINFNATKRREMTLRLGYLSSPQKRSLGLGERNHLLMLELGILLL